MRLLIVGPKWVGGWTESVARAARSLGHTPVLFYYDAFGVVRLGGGTRARLPRALGRVVGPVADRLGRLWEIHRMNPRLRAAVRAIQPDAILVLKGETLSAETLAALRARNRPLAAWWIDDPLRFPEAASGLGFFDVLYVFDKGRFAELQTRGARRLVYLPCACDPAIFHPQTVNPADYPELNCAVALVAAYYPERGALLSHLRGLDVGVWGPGWEAAPELNAMPPGTWRGRRLVPQQVTKIYNLAQICPNAHHAQTRVGGLNMRTFEVLAAGGFQLVDAVAGLEECFEAGREIVTYTSPAHCRELADYYLAHPAERAALTERGRARVLRDHTYAQRLTTILKTLPT